jgi:hypothetical protein
MLSINFMQGLDDGEKRTIWVDDVHVIDSKSEDKEPPPVPQGLSAKGFDRHVDLAWQGVEASDLLTYRIYRSVDGRDFEPLGTQQGQWSRYEDFIGESGREARYRVTAIDLAGNESAPSEAASASTREFSDDELLDMVQEACFRYYWEAAHPAAGLAPEVLPGDNRLIALGGNGFGVMALLAATERQFITRQESVDRMLTILRFLDRADRFHGVWPHFLDAETGKTIPFFGRYDNGGDLVETAFMMQGLRAARQYFTRDNAQEREIRDTVTRFWRDIEWDWYRRDPDSKVLYWHWSPDAGFRIQHPLVGWNETMITLPSGHCLAHRTPCPPASTHTGWAGTDELNVHYRQNLSRTTQGDHYINGKQLLRHQAGRGQRQRIGHVLHTLFLHGLRSARHPRPLHELLQEQPRHRVDRPCVLHGQPPRLQGLRRGTRGASRPASTTVAAAPCRVMTTARSTSWPLSRPCPTHRMCPWMPFATTTATSAARSGVSTDSTTASTKRRNGSRKSTWP